MNELQLAAVTDEISTTEIIADNYESESNDEAEKMIDDGDDDVVDRLCDTGDDYGGDHDSIDGDYHGIVDNDEDRDGDDERNGDDDCDGCWMCVPLAR